MPFAAVVFVLASLSSMGMPGFAGFWAEFNIFMGMWDRFPLISILAAVSIPITAAYLLRAIYVVFFGEVKDASFFNLPKLTWQEYTGATILVAVILIVGLYPGILTEMISSGVKPVAQAIQNAGTLSLGR
jgi:NADH-quinone oxidoreductase subunit M